MATREITGTLRRLDGNAWPGQKIRFELMTDFAVASLATMQQTVYEVTTAADGTFTAALEVPATNGWRYACFLPDGQSFEFVFGAGAATTLRAIIGDLSISVTEEVAASIADLLAGKVNVDEDAVDGNVAIFASGHPVDSGLAPGDIGVTDHGNLTGLGDDDHTQYLLASGGRALAGAWDMGDAALTNVNISSVTAAIAIAVGGTGATSAADARTNLGLVAGGAGDIWVEKAGDTMTGSLLLQASGAAATPLTVKMAASPTASPVKVTDSADAVYFELTADDGIVFRNRSSNASVVNEYLVQSVDDAAVTRMILSQSYLSFRYSGGNEWFRVENDANLATVIKADRPPLAGYGGYIRGGQTTVGSARGLALYLASNTGLMGFANASRAAWGMVFNADQGGGMDVVIGNSTAAEAAQAAILNDTAGDIGLIVRGAAGQTANILSIQNSAATVLASVSPAGQVGIGISSGLAGDLHVRQDSATGARPPLALQQDDVSEEMIRFIGSAAAATLTQSIVAAADVSVATIAGYVKVYIQDDGNQITDQAYYMPVYTLA